MFECYVHKKLGKVGSTNITISFSSFLSSLILMVAKRRWDFLSLIKEKTSVTSQSKISLPFGWLVGTAFLEPIIGCSKPKPNWIQISLGRLLKFALNEIYNKTAGGFICIFNIVCKFFLFNDQHLFVLSWGIKSLIKW